MNICSIQFTNTILKNMFKRFLICSMHNLVKLKNIYFIINWIWYFLKQIFIINLFNSFINASVQFLFWPYFMLFPCPSSASYQTRVFLRADLLFWGWQSRDSLYYFSIDNGVLLNAYYIHVQFGCHDQ